MRRFVVAVLAGIFFPISLGCLQSAAFAQSDPSAPAPAATQTKKKAGAAVTAPTAPTAKKKSTPTKKSVSTTKKRRPISPRVRRVRQAFTASASLRPMAQQLLQDRTPIAYAGVEAYARRHAKTKEDADAAALAWLVIGYARTLDHDYGKAIDPLNRAKAGASELGDYVAYYLGESYLNTAHNAEALATLADFGKHFPDSLLIRDAHLLYANALLEEGRAADAAAILEKDRAPVRSDIELAVGRAYQAAGDNQKAAAAFRNVYFNLPNSAEADAAGIELRKLGISGSTAERRTRADLLLKTKHYGDAIHDYEGLVNEATPATRADLQLALASASRKKWTQRRCPQDAQCHGSPNRRR